MEELTWWDSFVRSPALTNYLLLVIICCLVSVANILDKKLKVLIKISGKGLDPDWIENL